MSVDMIQLAPPAGLSWAQSNSHYFSFVTNIATRFQVSNIRLSDREVRPAAFGLGIRSQVGAFEASIDDFTDTPLLNSFGNSDPDRLKREDGYSSETFAFRLNSDQTMLNFGQLWFDALCPDASSVSALWNMGYGYRDPSRVDMRFCSKCTRITGI